MKSKAQRHRDLFAALNCSVISMCDDRHRHQGWQVPESHLSGDATRPLDATHKHPRVQAWLATRPARGERAGRSGYTIDTVFDNVGFWRLERQRIEDGAVKLGL